jgi:hypothetical protein
MTTTDLSCGPARRALDKSVLVPLMAAWRMGVGSVKERETGEARCAIAVISDQRSVMGE